MGCLLGIDVGSKRIGVAISDINRSIASPHGTVDGGDLGEAAEEIAELVEAEQPDAIVVGWPLNLDGTEGRATQMVRDFVAAVEDELEGRGEALPIERWDERMSSKGAESVLLEADLSRDRRRAVVDRVAAAKILQSYLDSLD
jgi:putative Holliday junction resolvase